MDNSEHTLPEAGGSWREEGVLPCNPLDVAGPHPGSNYARWYWKAEELHICRR